MVGERPRWQSHLPLQSQEQPRRGGPQAIHDSNEVVFVAVYPTGQLG